MEMSILQIWPLGMTRTHTSGCTQALALDPEAVAEDRFDSGDICRISVQDASLAATWSASYTLIVAALIIAN